MNAISMLAPAAPAVSSELTLAAPAEAAASNPTALGGVFAQLLGGMIDGEGPVLSELANLDPATLLTEGAVPTELLSLTEANLTELTDSLIALLGDALPSADLQALASKPLDEQLQALSSMLSQVTGLNGKDAMAMIKQAVGKLTDSAEDLGLTSQKDDELLTTNLELSSAMAHQPALAVAAAPIAAAMAAPLVRTAAMDMRAANEASTAMTDAADVDGVATSARAGGEQLLADKPASDKLTAQSTVLANATADAKPDGSKAALAAMKMTPVAAEVQNFSSLLPDDLPMTQLMMSATPTAAPAAPLSTATTQTWTVPGHMLTNNPAWSAAMSDRLTWMAGNGLESATLMITPDDLGPIHVKISMADAGAQVAFSADHADTQTLLDKLSPRLVAAFEAQGMRLDDVRVYGGASEAAARDFQQQQQQQQAQQQAQQAAANSQAGTEQGGQTFAQVLDGDHSAVASSPANTDNTSRVNRTSERDSGLDVFA